MTATPSLAPLLECFFTQRLMQQRRVSPHTISSYRDTFRQFLKFTQQRCHKRPSAPAFQEIDAPLVVAFLGHLARISHTIRCIGAPNQRKVLCSNYLSLIHGAPRCRQSVPRIRLDLKLLKGAKW